MRKSLGFHNRHSPFNFNPATLFAAGQQGAWYDPSDLSTLFQDSAGTVPVTAVGDPVGRILDKSGNGNHATQSVNASRPAVGQTNGLYHLTFDGSNDSLSTNSIDFTAADSMTIFSGLTKSSDAATAIVAELSASLDLNARSFALFAPSAGGANKFRYFIKSATASVATDITSTTYNAPITAVVTALNIIPDDIIALRINGQQISGNSNDQGTGTFGNYPLFIGRRNNTNLPFNGRLYGLIVLGAAASSWQIQVTEQWMAGKTGLQF